MGVWGKAFPGSAKARTFLQSGSEMFPQQLLLNGGDQRFSGGGGQEETNATEELITSCWKTKKSVDTDCVLWSRYVMTLSASSSRRLLT